MRKKTNNSSVPGTHTARSSPWAHRVRSRARSSPWAHRVRSRARSSPGAHRAHSSLGAYRARSTPWAHRVRSRARSSPGAHRARSSLGAHRARSSPWAHRVRSRARSTPGAHRVRSRARSTPGAHRVRSRARSTPGAHRVRSTVLLRSCCCAQAGHQMFLCVEHMACCLLLVPCAPMSIAYPLPSCLLVSAVLCWSVVFLHVSVMLTTTSPSGCFFVALCFILLLNTHSPALESSPHLSPHVPWQAAQSSLYGR